MKTSIALLVFTTVVAIGEPTNSFPLWPDRATGALGDTEKDAPTLTVFLPEAAKATGAAMIVCPGGGYGSLAPHEGEGYARWLNDLGIAAFVLKYRLGSAGYHHPVMLQDAARAMRSVKARASEWKVDAKRVGIIGSSAGGHLASTLLTHFDDGKADAADVIDRQSSRPDFGILCYAVITMGEFTHGGSRKNLLGGEPSPELIRELSNELQVTSNTPPCFVWHTAEDKVVPVENSVAFASALRKAGVPFELHVYEKGAHGIGLGSVPYGGGERHRWTLDCAAWLRERGLAK